MQEKKYSVKIELTQKENEKFKATYLEIAKAQNIEEALNNALIQLSTKIQEPEKYISEVIACKKISYIPKLKQLKMQL